MKIFEAELCPVGERSAYSPGHRPGFVVNG